MASVRKCRDFNELSRIVAERVRSVAKNLAPVNGRSVTVRIDPSAVYPNGKKVSDVARMIEYGTAQMAPRPFMRDAIIENGSRWRKMIKKKIVDVARGKGGNYRNSLMSVAKTMAQDVKSNITKYKAVRTGMLRDSVIGEVE